jgi:hypothetical protein
MPVTVGLVDFLIHPPVGALEPVRDGRGPYLEGNTRITTYDGSTTVANTKGVWIWAYRIPPEWGRTVGYNDPLGRGIDCDDYDPSWGQIAVMHQFITGDVIVDQQARFTQLKELVLWNQILPSEIGLYLAPGWEADLYWMFVL